MSNDRILIGVVIALVGLAVWSHQHGSEPAKQPDCPDGKCPVPVMPTPKPEPIPEPPRPTPRRPWGNLSASSVEGEGGMSWSAEAKVGGPEHEDGTRLACELPGKLHQRNTGGSDGAGLCVFASMRHSGLWQGNAVFADLFNWMRNHPGGSYPDKTDKMIARYCQEKGLPKPKYIQVEGADLEILKKACRSGRMPGVTYGKSPSGRYSGKPISHMVSLPHADDKHFVVLDNNYPGESQYEWLTPEEFKRAYVHTGGQGWAIILLDPGPPPRPWNQVPKEPTS